MGNQTSSSSSPEWDCTSGPVNDASQAVERIPEALGFSSCCKRTNESKTEQIVEVPVYAVDGAPPDMTEFFATVNKKSPNSPSASPQAGAPKTLGNATPEEIMMIEAKFRNERTDRMQPATTGVPDNVTIWAPPKSDAGEGQGDITGTKDPRIALLPAQCLCCPSALSKPDESELLKQKGWCLYCCCMGLGCSPALQPFVHRLDCSYFHSICESAYFSEPAQGISSLVCTCYNASCIFQLPIRQHSPLCICCNERFCYKGGKAQLNADLGTGTPQPRIRRSSIEMSEESTYIIEERWVQCLCGCCACAESYGKNCCGFASKCCCTRCGSRCGAPSFPGCVALSLCCCSFFQCRCPKLVVGTPLCICCTVNLTECCKFRFCHPRSTRRCPERCEKCKCCSFSEYSPYLWYACCCKWLYDGFGGDAPNGFKW